MTSLTPSFGNPRQFNIPVEWPTDSAPRASWAASLTLTADGTGRIYLGEVLISDDGTRSTGFRVRVFDRAGAVTKTWGVGGDQAEVTWPSMPNVDSEDRLWVIDLDTTLRSYTIKVLEL